jgi:BirA family biotin operon repressor/biotin-[acetyl-CoA-carboxylase] ligase
MPANLVSKMLRGGLYTRLVGQRVLFFQELSSTMDEAAQQAKKGALEGTTIVAESQTASRGRMGRRWVSQPGNLYLTILFYPRLEHLGNISIIGGVATVRAIRKTTGLNPRIKWPNDVLLKGNKVAGILVESSVVGDAVGHAALGIGINVALDTRFVDEISSFATSLAEVGGEAVPREDLLRRLLQELDSLYTQVQQGNSPLEEWREMLDTLGQRVRVTWQNETFQGLAEGVDELGNLQLRRDDGGLLTLSAGDVTMQSPVTA